MKSQLLRRSFRWLGALLLGGALLFPLGGCPIDSDVVLTETVRAGLEAAVSSLVETLSTYLAGN